MDKIDFKKTYRAYYSPKPGQPEILTIPKMQFAMIDGRGDPNGSKEFQDAVSALYGIVYTIKFGRKKAGVGPDYGVGALEGLWWTKDGKMFGIGKPEDWLWTLMIWLPDVVTPAEFKVFTKELAAKKAELPTSKLRLEYFEEGLVVQIMHLGPYDTERASVKLMHDLAESRDYSQSGKHHEIYLSDPRRVAPEKNRTIIRHPLSKIVPSP